MDKRKFSTKVKMAVVAFLLFLGSLIFQPAPPANVANPDTQADGSSWGLDLRSKQEVTPRIVVADGSSWGLDLIAPPPPPVE